MREIGGRNDLVFVESPSARFGRGFFSSINDTVSIICFGDFGVSGGFGFAGDSAGVFAAGADGFRTGSISGFGVGGAVVVAAFAGASTFVLFASFRFGSAAGRDETAALTGLRAGAVLRAAVLVVVFVGI
jgi:hypothetical protein